MKLHAKTLAYSYNPIVAQYDRTILGNELNISCMLPCVYCCFSPPNLSSREAFLCINLTVLKVVELKEGTTYRERLLKNRCDLQKLIRTVPYLVLESTKNSMIFKKVQFILWHYLLYIAKWVFFYLHVYKPGIQMSRECIRLFKISLKMKWEAHVLHCSLDRKVLKLQGNKFPCSNSVLQIEPF